MATDLREIGTVWGQGFDLPAGPAALTSVATGTGVQVAVAQYGYSATQHVILTAGGAAALPDPVWHSPDSRAGLSGSALAGSLPQATLDTALAHWDLTGGGSGQRVYLGAGALAAEAATVIAASWGGQDLLFAAAATGAGISAFRLDAGGRPGTAVVRGDTADQYLDAVADLALIATEQGLFLYGGSASEHGVSGYRVGADGSLTPVTDLGRSESLPVQGVSALEPVTVAGQDYLIAAAAGSSSLSVLSVRADGALGVTDHVIDTLDTRFAHVTTLTHVMLDGQAFVLAAGSDAGVSLLRLTAGGRLVHVTSLAESGSGALEDLTGLAAARIPGGAMVLGLAEGRAGGGLFRLEHGEPGVTLTTSSGALTGGSSDDVLSLTAGNGTIAGGAGDDLISDGPGQDRLSGGAGADVFVLRADGVRDVISDITPGQDRIDLSGWPFLRSALQLDIESTAWGALVRFETEVLELRSAAGTRLEAAEVAALLDLSLSHAEVTLAPLQTTGPTPDPEPFPDTVPGPDPLVAAAAPAPRPAPSPAPSPPSAAPGPGPAAGPAGPAGRVIEGGDGADTLSGEDGNDTVLGRAGADWLSGGAGDDVIAASDGNDRAVGGPGRDNIGGGPGDDRIEGDAGQDTLGGGQGDDTILGGADSDVIGGGPGDDLIEGGEGADNLAGSFGNDTVKGQAGDDAIGGGTGRDRLIGDDGNDTIGGGEGDDIVKGGAGRDFLAGGGRDDRIEGGEGADTLNGGTGDDWLQGGGGADLFVFNALLPGERDIIDDFQPGVDMLRIGGLPGQGQAARFASLDISAAGGDALLRWNGHEIRLDGVDPAELGRADFLLT